GIDAAWHSVAAGQPFLLIKIAWTALLRVLLPVLLLAYAVMLLFWPWGQTDPIENPLRALLFFSHQDFPFSTLFAGRFVPASNLPWTYLPIYIALALPELILVLLICAPVFAATALLRAPGQVSREQVIAHFVLIVGIIFPV